MENQDLEPKQERKPYEPPAVVYETELEVRAGSPLGMPDPWLDPSDPAWLFKQR